MEKNELKARIKSIIAEIIEEDESTLDDNASFVDDLGVDSLRALEILARMEKEFKIQIPEEKLMDLTCVNSTIDIVLDIMNLDAAPSAV